MKIRNKVPFNVVGCAWLAKKKALNGSAKG